MDFKNYYMVQDMKVNREIRAHVKGKFTQIDSGINGGTGQWYIKY